MCLASLQSRSMWCVQHLETLRKYFFAENIIPRGWTGASLSIVRSISSQKGVFPGSLHLRQHNERSLCNWRWETKRVHIALHISFTKYTNTTKNFPEISCGGTFDRDNILAGNNGVVQIAVSQKPTILNSCCSPANNCQSISKKILKWNTSHISSLTNKTEK